LKDYLVDALQSPRARQRGYFQARFVDRLVSEHLSGRRDHALRLWQLLMFELWHRRHLDRPLAESDHTGGTSFPLDHGTLPQKANLPSGIPVHITSSGPF
jgi:hypothetical protein